MKEKIILVDDSPDFLLLLTSLFKFHDIAVEAESDAHVALKKIQTAEYLMVITDYMMGEMNGLELARKIRETANNKKIKVLIMSYKTLDEDELKQIQQLDLSYLRKPIMPNELLAKIKEMTKV